MSDDRLLPALLRAWAPCLGADPACERLAERSFVYLVRAPGGDFILKEAALVNPRGDAARKLSADIAVLRHLKAQGVPVAPPEPTADGQPYRLHEGRYYTLSPALPSQTDPDAPLERVYHNIGAAIARLHRALAGYPGPIYSWTMDLPPRILDEALPVLLRHQNAEQNLRLNAAIETLRLPLTERLVGLPCQTLHGDCHGGNVLLVGAEVSGFIDLDHLPHGPRIYDPCYYLLSYGMQNYQSPAGAENWLETAIPALFTGYAQVSPLSPAERDAAPEMMLGALLILSAWLFEPLHLPEWAHGDMRFFHWLYEHREQVRASAKKIA